MIKILLLGASLLGASVSGAAADAAPPTQVDLVFDVYRNGQKLGQMTDTLTRAGSRYTLVSETRATGSLKLLWPGNIRLESTGTVTPRGLRPERFQHARSDAPQKLATAQLQWKQRSVAYQYKGESREVKGLRVGAQDQLSQLYQFMFLPRAPSNLALQVVSGRDLNDYRYTRRDGETLQTPLGRLATKTYTRVNRQPDEKAITVWVAPDRNNLPVQVRITEDGVTLEQRLVRASVKD